MTRLISAGSIVLGILLAGAEALAQPAGAGAIDGRVKDETGALLPGVAVTISSDALMGTQTVSTNHEGVFRFPAVPVGEYTLQLSLEGFESVTQPVYVSIGFTATIDTVLHIAPLKQGVVVERHAPVVDPHSTAVATNFNAFQLGNLPGARSMGAILAATPAVQMTRFDVGGSTEVTGIYGAYGIFGANRPTIEGIFVGGLLPYGFALDYGSFEEVSVGTGAHGAEWPLPGVQLQFVTKSGGNRYRGTIYGDYENRHWQSLNIDNDQIARGARGGIGLAARDSNRLWSYRDINADVGGYMRKDAIWWYSSVRDQDVSRRLVNFPVKPFQTHISNFTAKTTYRVSARDRVIAFAQLGRNHQPNRLPPFGIATGTAGPSGPTAAIYPSEESTANQRATGWVWKGEWNSAMTDRLYIELRAGQFGARRPETPNGSGPRFEDIGSLVAEGGSRDWQEDLGRGQLIGSVSFLPADWLGSHQIKIGGEIIRSTASETWRTSFPQDVLHVLRNGEPVDVYLFEAPSRSESGLWVYAAYASDTWRLKDRLTLNLGLRFDRYRLYFPDQTHPASRFNPTAQIFAAVDTVKAWNVIAPRMSVTFDLDGGGRTLAKTSYARYSGGASPQLGLGANPNANQWWTQYLWTDHNANGTWDDGEQGRLVNRRGGVAIESLDPNLELSVVDELAGWIERDLGSNTGIRSGIVWRADRQNSLRQNASQPFEGFSVAVPLNDPGPDGAPGTADDGNEIRAFALGPEFVNLDPLNVLRNIADSDSFYWTWETTATKRFTDRWSFVAGFAHTWYDDHASAYLGQPVRNNAFPLTPNDLINTGSHGQHQFRMWSVKVHGTYAAPWGVRVTPYLRHQSGQPFGRTFVSSLNVGSVRILAEPIGTRRMDNITIFDMRLEKGFVIASNRRAAVFVDLFNLFNANAEQGLSWSSGGSFLRPLNIISPRIARVGAKLEW